MFQLSELILVIGSAHLDILASSAEQTNLREKSGEITIEIGGTAAVIAMEMARMGVNTRLLTTTSRNPYAMIVTEYLSQYGIETVVETVDNNKIGAYVGHLDRSGDLISAVMATPIEDHLFKEETIADALDHATCVVLDCNLAGAALNELVQAANARLIPVFVVGTSEDKCLRIKDIKGLVDALFINQREYDYLRQWLSLNVGVSHICARYLATTLVVYRGYDGIELINQNGATTSIPVVAQRDGEKHLLGLRNVFVAATIFLHVIKEEPLVRAASSAIGYALSLNGENIQQSRKAGSVDVLLHAIQHNAACDVMTELLNRAAVEKRLEMLFQHTKRSEQPLAVMMIDIDYFKSINDSYGHPAGDEVIKAVANTIRREVRESDIAGRWGGEEFICVLPGAQASLAALVAERIRCSVETHIQKPRPVTVSIGLSERSALDAVWSTIIDRADQALYDAKNSGRNKISISNAIAPTR